MFPTHPSNTNEAQAVLSLTLRDLDHIRYMSGRPSVDPAALVDVLVDTFGLIWCWR